MGRFRVVFLGSGFPWVVGVMRAQKVPQKRMHSIANLKNRLNLKQNYAHIIFPLIGWPRGGNLHHRDQAFFGALEVSRGSLKEAG